MISTIILPNVVSIDHSYVDDLGRIKGRSYMASFLITGPVDNDDERVVANASKVSGLIKDILEDRKCGVNHKLWLGPNFKDFSSIPALVSPFVEVYLPEDAIYTFHGEEHLSTTFTEEILSAHVGQALRELHGLFLDVSCTLRTTPTFLPEGGVYGTFSYTHGLRDSTSYGRQNLVNGCTGYLQLIHKSFGIRPLVNPIPSIFASSNIGALCSELCKDLDNTMFLFSDNVVYHTDVATCVGYHARSRGPMSATFVHDEQQKIVILETETTLEHIAEYINAKYGEILKEAGVAKFIVSAGLLNGVLFEIE